MAKLVLVGRGVLTGKTFPVPDCAKFGRADDADLRFNAPDISRHHCTFFQLEGKWYIQDANSLNGTFLNEASVSGATLLCEGDALQMGPAIFDVSFQS